MIEFRIIDLRTEVIDPNPKTVLAPSPERAVELALGLSLVRSGAKHDLRARVYSQQPGRPVSTVRMYAKVSDRPVGDANVR